MLFSQRTRTIQGIGDVWRGCGVMKLEIKNEQLIAEQFCMELFQPTSGFLNKTS